MLAPPQGVEDGGVPRYLRSVREGAGPGSVPGAEPVPRMPGLPVHLSTFVGRAAEVDRLADLLEGSRLVTLLGPGGCGKTRLALRVAETVADAHGDGTAFVDLAPVADE